MQDIVRNKKSNDDPILAIEKIDKDIVKKIDSPQQSAANSLRKVQSTTTAECDEGPSEEKTKVSEKKAAGEFIENDVATQDKINQKDREKPKTHNNREQEMGTSSGRGVGNVETMTVDKESENTMELDSSARLDNNSTTTDKDLTSEKKNGNKSSTPTPVLGPPIMRGTLSVDLNGQRHLIRGMWNYENSNDFPAQRFELVRNLDPEEDKRKLPVDGVFHGSFSLAYIHTTSKGKQKERSRVVPETGVSIKFTPLPDKEGEYMVDGKGTNQYGVFNINGTATPSGIPDDETLSVVLKKCYEPAPAAPVAETSSENNALVDKSNKSISSTASTVAATNPPSGVSEVDNNPGQLPEPTKSFASGVVALRGNLYREESMDLGVIEVVHRINGMWAGGLDLILADPQNVQGLCNRFEYEHKTSGPSQQFPVSGRYSGWFELSNEDATRTRINERDVTLKFRPNNAGYHNIEGKGSNVFGKYTITGTLTLDNVITIFRVFLPRKIKTKIPAVVPSSAGIGGPDPGKRFAYSLGADLKLKLEDVDISAFVLSEKNGAIEEPFDPISPPPIGSYAAVSQGVLRVNEDGSHSCQGKWAVTREHFTNSLTSNFNFRLEAHFAQDAINNSEATNGEHRQFPLDSALYKGSFQMKKQGARLQTILDQQIVMKFRKNTQGSFNVYGTGLNAFGEFNLLGTLVMSGKAGGQVELYRIYKPEKMTAPPEEASTIVDEGLDLKPMMNSNESTSALLPVAVGSGASNSIIPTNPERSILRRESTRMPKLPSRLEEDDPGAQLSRIMEKCNHVLKYIRERDKELGAFFCEPVDPVELGIPTYHKVIKEPMDLRTIQRKMDSDEITKPEEFIRMMRLVFENAMTFNIDPGHSVHQAARSLLVKFNDKIKDIERSVQLIRRSYGLDDESKDKKKRKEEKKRKRLSDENKSLKKQRLEEVEAMVNANANAVAVIVAAAPLSNSSHVTRTEFNLLLSLIQTLQDQIVQTHTALAGISPDEVIEGPSFPDAPPNTKVSSAPKTTSAANTKSVSAPAPAPATEKKPVKKKAENVKPVDSTASEDEATPLSNEEREWLTENISELPQEHLGGVLQIIREAARVELDEDEIEIDIDQLDHRTQRKLIKHVLKFVKKSKPKTKKKIKTSQQEQQPKRSSERPPPAKKPKQAPKPKPAATAESFFAFGGKSGSDQDSSSSSENEEEGSKPEIVTKKNEASNEFKLNSGLGDFHNDDDDDLESDGIAGNWNIPDPTNQVDKKGDDKDLEWAAAAREQAAANKARDADRKAREEKKKKEAEEANRKAMIEASKRKEELLAKQAEEKEKEASLIEQQEKEAERAREQAREKARAEAQAVEQTVDLDAQRELMRQLDQSFLDNDSMGGASPSSDFGF